MADTGATIPGQIEGQSKPPTAERITLSWSHVRSSKSVPSAPSEWEAKGDALVSTGKTAEALECYTKGLAEDAGNLELWMKKADAFISMKRFRSALFCTDSALAKDGSRYDIWLMRAILLHASGDNEKAVEAVNYALSLKGDAILGWAIKAESLMDLGKFDEARSCIDLAKDMDEKNKELLLLEKNLEMRIADNLKCPLCGAKAPSPGAACEKCKVDILIEDAQISIQTAKDEGKSVAEAEELLSSAKAFRDRGFWSQADKVSRPLPQLLGKDWQAGAWALQFVDEAEDVSEALEADKMVGTVSIREKTEKVRDAVKVGQSAKAVVLGRQALEHAKKIAQKYSTILLKDRQIRKVKPASGPVCPKCGESVDPDWVKCPVCKGMLKDEPVAIGPIPPAPAKAPPQQQKPTTPGELNVTDGGALFCPQCHEEVEDFWMKCLFCGAKLMGPGAQR